MPNDLTSSAPVKYILNIGPGTLVRTVLTVGLNRSAIPAIILVPAAVSPAGMAPEISISVFAPIASVIALDLCVSAITNSNRSAALSRCVPPPTIIIVTWLPALSLSFSSRTEIGAPIFSVFSGRSFLAFRYLCSEPPITASITSFTVAPANLERIFLMSVSANSRPSNTR